MDQQKIRVRDLLQMQLNLRKKKYGKYSLRRFAKDLEVSSSYLSMVLSGKRSVNKSRAMNFAKSLCLDSQTTEVLVLAAAREASLEGDSTDYVLHLEKEFRSRSLNEALNLPLKNYYFANDYDEKLLGEWYHFAILDLTTVKDFKPDIQWISDRLALHPLRVLEAIDELRQTGLLEIENGKWTKKSRKMAVVFGESKRSLREHHRTMMKKAMEELNNTDEDSFMERSITSTTVAIDRSRAKELRTKIRKIIEDFSEDASAGPCSDVFQFNLQFFPLTKKEGPQK